MEYKSLSAGELADLLEVQRSNISHVLNGRNKPGANFIEKLLLNFPDINARWLLTGIGEMTVNHNTNDEPSLDVNEPAPEQLSVKPTEKPERKESSSSIASDKKKIDKIVVLFNDGTFTDYEKHRVE